MSDNIMAEARDALGFYPSEKDESFPAKKMWAFCILEAIDILQKNKKGAADEWRWLFKERAPDRVGSFDWVCDALGLDSVRLRKRISRDLGHVQVKKVRTEPAAKLESCARAWRYYK